MPDVAAVRYCQEHNVQITFAAGIKTAVGPIAERKTSAAAGFLNLVDVVGNTADQDIVPLIELTVVQRT